MKTLGTEQLLAKKFVRLPLSDEWKGVMGNLAEVFMMIIYGESGEGKTEFCMQFALELAQHNSVKWVGYETGHAADIQDAVARNKMKGHPINWIDPWEESANDKKILDAFVPPSDMPMNKDVMANRLFIALYLEMNKQKSAKYWFIDSADALHFTEQQMLYLRAKFVKKKGIIFIAHAEGKKILKAVCRAIEFYGQTGIWVKSYIAEPLKSRFNGWGLKIIFAEKAKELDPVRYENIMKAQKVKAKKVNKQAKVVAAPVVSEIIINN